MILALLSALAVAGEPPTLLPEAVPRPAEPETGLRFVGLFDTKLSVNDIGTESALVNGQIVGTLGGTNATTLQATPAGYAEQRALGMFRYTPRLLDGKASLVAAFEVDFAWGDSSYATGGNTGGGFGGDQVNLQTKRLAARFRVREGLVGVVGLQFVGDGAVDPEGAKLDDLLRGGGHLLFFGSEAAGLSLYGRAFDDQLRYKLGGYTLVEQALAEPDDITLWMADTRWSPAYATTVGLHGWYLRDRAGGTGGVIGTGPTSALSEMQGGPRLDFRDTEGEAQPEVSAALAWIVADGSYNAALDKGRFGVAGLGALNLGRLYVTDKKDANVRGLLLDVEGRARYAPGAGSVVRVEGLYSTGDSTPQEGGDLTYTGVFTGNTYGIVGANYLTHGCMLLFPDANSINRQVAVVYDVSGAGKGVLGLSGQVGYDPLPNKLTVAVGGGIAQDAKGQPLGQEVNLRVVGRPLPLLNVGAYGAVATGTALQQELGVMPWTSYLALNWVVY